MPRDQDIGRSGVLFASFAGQPLVADNSNDPGTTPVASPVARSAGQRLFGQPHAPMQRPAFGRRVRTPQRPVETHKAWLRTLHAELLTVFSDPFLPDSGVPIRFVDAQQPMITLGNDVTIGLDALSGVYVLQRQGDQQAETITMPDNDQVLDFVAAHLARTAQGTLKDQAPTAPSVGRTIEDMERALVLSTLRHCRGNRARAADMLGITRRALRAKLQCYWEGPLAQERQEQNEEPGDVPTAQ
jgi:hypothetical protein